MSGLARGDWVFVHPDDRSAPPKVRGLAGTIVRTAGGRATVSFRAGEGSVTVEVDVGILSPERRRRDRKPAEWPGRDLAAAS